MNQRWRILIVVTRSPPGADNLPDGQPRGLPPRDAALTAARLLALGAEVRIIDQECENQSDRLVRREARLWRADLVLLYAGGSSVRDDPVPDASPLVELLARWNWGAPLIAIGPLARRWGAGCLESIPTLSGAMIGDVGAGVLHVTDAAAVPACMIRDGGGFRVTAEAEGSTGPAAVLPAWHALSLSAYDGAGHSRRRLGVWIGSDVKRALAEVGHAVRRGGAGMLVMADEDLGQDAERLGALCEGMMGTAPTVPWTCRVRADRVDPMLALALLRGGCKEVTVCSPAGPDAPGLPPMDDPARRRLESAVDALRTVGASVVVEHELGRPGHTPDVLGAWQRWFLDRRIAVSPRVRWRRPEPPAPGQKLSGQKLSGQKLSGQKLSGGLADMQEALRAAGCLDNDLRPRDVQRAIRQLTARQRAGASS